MPRPPILVITNGRGQDQQHRMLRPTFLKAHPKAPQVAITNLRRSSTAAPAAFKKITVIGAGLMGSGIAQVAAQAGISVTLHGLNDKLCQDSRSLITQSLTRVARKKFQDDPGRQTDFVDSTLSHLTMSTDLSLAVEGPTELVVEAIVEKIEVKRDLFAELDQMVQSSECLFASNTSSLKIGDISAAVSAERQKKFAGLHFFNPVPQMKLVEIIKTAETSEDTVQKLAALCQQIDKISVNCLDTPGFIVNRLLVPYLLEAMRMVSRGHASAKDVDTAMKLGAGHPMGPIELADYVGLDTMKFISDGWRQSRVESGEIESSLVEPVDPLDKLVAEGKFGKKTKEGFYKY